MHDDRRWTAPVLLAAVALGVVIAAVGLASRPSLSVPRPHGADPHATRDWALSVALLLLGVALLVRARGRPRYQATTYRLVGACLLVAPLLLVNVVRATRLPHPSTPGGFFGPTSTTGTATAATPATSAATQPGVGHNFRLGGAASTVSLLLTLAACMLLAIVAFRAMRRPGRHVAPRILEAPRDADDVLASATAAIALGGDPRGRVIAAYEAMETALTGEGAPRGAPQAPLEWIAGLAESHPAAVAPARELAEIFERARFRSAPVTDADAALARAALDRLRATLAVRQP
ncbi:MAG TPA: DUF4129 domain-containing protein [Jatrophihabitantaceae bacterium]